MISKELEATLNKLRRKLKSEFLIGTKVYSPEYQEYGLVIDNTVNPLRSVSDCGRILVRFDSGREIDILSSSLYIICLG
jgi:phage gp37-like protein